MTSGGNNFNDYPENQLTEFSLLRHRFPFSWYHLGERPLDYTTDCQPRRRVRILHLPSCISTNGRV